MSLKNKKKKGTDAERDLIHIFWKNGWAAVRIAGSGSMKYPSPDILAGKNGTLYAIECKTTKSDKQYFEKKEIQELKEFSKITAAMAFVAVKYQGEEWKFYPLTSLTETEKRFVATKKDPHISITKIIN
ncbi:Holliday junction resolvase [Candidatus Woesearchaeota archaeon]|nr:MAG: Holliday junction resolvase [Candidatus Woesearchaeota archaeon]